MSVGCVGAVAVDRIFIDHPSSLNTYLQDNAVKMERFLLWPDVGINNWEVLAGAARQLSRQNFYWPILTRLASFATFVKKQSSKAKMCVATKIFWDTFDSQNSYLILPIEEEKKVYFKLVVGIFLHVRY
jgi:hypothetical protein